MASHKLLVVALVGILCTASAQHGEACTCPMRPPVAKAVEAADLVVRGTVVEVIDVSDTGACRAIAQGTPPPPDEFTAYCGLVVTLSIDTVWKGARKPKVTVVTGHGGGDCGAEFATATQYVVFARKLKGGALYTDGCTYTGEAAGVAQVIKELGLPLWGPSA